MKVTLGRMVLVQVRGESFNGTDECPAVITRNWGGEGADTNNGAVGVNLMLLPDCSPPQARTSVMLFAEKDEALAHLNTGATIAAWVPERV